jgi:hypothetical protein
MVLLLSSVGGRKGGHEFILSLVLISMFCFVGMRIPLI